MKLTTNRLILRQFCQSDFEEYAAMVGHTETMRYIGNGEPLSREQAWRSMAAILGHWQLLGYGLYAVEEKSSGKLAGRIGLINPEGWPGIEIGWMLHPDFRGRGLAFEAAVAIMTHAFEVLKVRELISLIHPMNTASLKLAEKLGESLHDYIQFFGVECAVYKIKRELFLASPPNPKSM
ncbi:MAG: N-acetyltransferase [Calditrichaeota bacterium]|nr:MAG: N-acetyltransferase [Calditrichota bacterium]